MAVPAGMKLAGLCLGLVALLFVRSIELLCAAGLGVLLLWLLARLTWRAAWKELRPIALIAALTWAFNVWFLGAVGATLLSGRMVLAFALAALVSLTTPTSELIDVVQRLFRPLIGYRRAEHLGLMVSLVIRTIPVISAIVREVVEARAARGMERSVRALAVPIVIRTLRTADDLGDALAARGMGDPESADTHLRRHTMRS